MELTDSELVQKAARGDRNAFHALVDRHAAELFRFALSLSANRTDAEDVVQETLIGAYNGLGRFDGRAAVKTWLKRILMRQAARTWNKSKRGRSMLPLEAADASPPPENGNGSGPDQVDRQIDVAEVLRLIAPEHRQVIVMREFEQMSYAEIAQVLEVPIGTVESRLHRARADLKSRLAEYSAR